MSWNVTLITWSFLSLISGLFLVVEELGYEAKERRTRKSLGTRLVSTLHHYTHHVHKHYCGIEVYYTQELREGESNQMSTHLQRRLRTLSHVPVY